MGVPKYHMTAAVWIRGMLEEEYGVAPKDLLWFEGGEGSKVKEVDVTLPPDVRRESVPAGRNLGDMVATGELRSEEHTSELQSQSNLVCRLLLEKKKKKQKSRL